MTVISPIIPARAGKYMHTAGGEKYWPTDPRSAEVTIKTIAHHLGNRCRYNGATQHPTDPTKIFYSVAEHSVICSWYVQYELGLPNEALEALLHDASEAYNGDLIRPLKYDDMFSKPFKIVEGKNELVIAERFKLQYPFPKSTSIADEAVTTAEMRQIIPRSNDEEWVSGMLHDETNIAPYTIGMWTPYEAKQRFINRFHDLYKHKADERVIFA